MVGQGRNVSSPCVPVTGLRPRRDPWLSQVVEHERLLGQARHQLHRRRQLLRIEQQVVGEATRVQLLESADELFAQEKPRIGLVLHDMPHTHEFFPRHELSQLTLYVDTPQIDPADNAADQRMLLCQFKQPAGLLERLSGLHGDRAADTSSRSRGLEVHRQIVAGQPLHAGPDPRIVRRRIAPEVLVGVDVHREKGASHQISFSTWRQDFILSGFDLRFGKLKTCHHKKTLRRNVNCFRGGLRCGRYF